MKLIIKFLAITILMVSCNGKETEYPYSLEVKEYRIVTFTSINTIDLNNDGVESNDILLETRNYNSLDLYDLRISVKRKFNFYSIFLPRQHIVSFSDFVDFSSYGYSIILDKGTNNIVNYKLDDETKIILFEMISENKCRLKLRKKYFDFSVNQYVNNEFEIIYEKIN